MKLFTVIRAAAAMVILTAVLCDRAVAADESIQFDYDIFRQGETLAVWLDLTPVMGQRRMEDLLAGLAVQITIDGRLEKPRWPLPSRTLSSGKWVATVTRRLTEDAYYLQIAGPSAAKYKFDNQLELSDFLADSLVFPVAATSSLKPAEKIRLSLTFVCNSLNPNTLSETPASPDQPGSGSGIFDRMFTFFNEAVGLGADTYRIVSPLFDPAALPDMSR